MGGSSSLAIYVCICMSVCTCGHLCAHVGAYVYVWGPVCMCGGSCARVGACVHVCIPVCTVGACVHVCMPVCMSVCLCSCVHTHAHMWVPASFSLCSCLPISVLACFSLSCFVRTLHPFPQGPEFACLSVGVFLSSLPRPPPLAHHTVPAVHGLCP